MDFENKFSNGKLSKNCATVGDVIDELSRLPRELPVEASFTESVDLVVFNKGKPDAHLEFMSCGDWDDDED